MPTNNVDWSPVFTNPAAPKTLPSFGRTTVAPLTPVSGATTVSTPSTGGASPGYPFVLPPPGTVIATFSASTLTGAYQTIPVGLAANLPKSPNVFYPVVGLPLARFVDTSVYLVFEVPTNVGSVSGLTIQLALCIDVNPLNADISGTQALFGTAMSVLTSGVSTIDDADFMSETLAQTVALPTKVGGFFIHSIRCVCPCVEGQPHVLRVTRRASQYQFDTNTGRILLLNVGIYT